jgi:hypothetical protein
VNFSIFIFFFSRTGDLLWANDKIKGLLHCLIVLTSKQAETPNEKKLQGYKPQQ